MSAEESAARINRLQAAFGHQQSVNSKQPSVFGGAKKPFTPADPPTKDVPPPVIPPPPGSTGRDARLPFLPPPPGYPLPAPPSLFDLPPFLSPFAPPGLPLLPIAPPGLSLIPPPFLPPPGLYLKPTFLPPPPGLLPPLFDTLPPLPPPPYLLPPHLPPPPHLLPFIRREQQKNGASIQKVEQKERCERKTSYERETVVSPSIASSMAVSATHSPPKLSPVPAGFRDSSFISSPSSASGPADFPTNDGWSDDDDIGPAVDDAFVGEFDPVPPRPPALGTKLLGKVDAPPNTPCDSVCNITAGPKKDSFSYEPPHAEVLERLNSSFKDLYKDTSRRMNISPTPIAEAKIKEKEEKRLVEEKEDQKEEKVVEQVSLSETLRSEISDRFGGPMMPPISEEEHLENMRILEKARAIMRDAGDKGEENEKHEDVLSLVERYFPKRNSIVADMSKLPKELVSVIDAYPQLFCVECESPGEVGVRLCGEVTAKKLAAPKSLRRANESDLEWLKNAPTVIDPTKDDMNCVSPLCFIAPRGILISAFWGNDQGERVCYVLELIKNYQGVVQPVAEIKPGMPCLVRADDDYARAVVIDKTPKGFQLAFLDFYETTEAVAENIFELPEELSVDRVRCSLLLARIFEVDSVPLDCQPQVAEKIEALNSGKCTAAIIVKPEVVGDLCACDIVVNNNRDWLSTVVKTSDVILHDSETQHFGIVEVNDQIVGRYNAGFYVFDRNQESIGVKEEIEVKEEPLIDVSCSQPNDEDHSSASLPAAVVVKEEGLVNFSTDTVEFNPNGHQPVQLISDNESQEENRSFEAPPARSLQDAEKLFHPHPQNHPISGDYVNHIRNYFGFVEATLAILNKENQRKQFIHESIAQAIFLKIHVVPAEADEERAVIDEKISSLRELAK